MNAKILNVSFYTSQCHLPSLKKGLKRHIAPLLGEVEHMWLQVEKIQGITPSADAQQSIALQCRFADEETLTAFLHEKLHDGVSDLLDELPHQQCMVFETQMNQLGL